MSFTENPFKHVSFGVTDSGRYFIECDSCGGEIQLSENPILSATIPLAVAHSKFMQHVIDSHKRTREDFATWS